MNYIIGIAGICALMLAWVGIQHWWRKAFSEHVNDHDVLAGRSDCGSCGCATACERKLEIQKNVE